MKLRSVNGSSKILSLIEPVATGHRFVYLDLIARGALIRGQSVIVSTTKENLSNDVIQGLQRDYDKLSVVAMDWPLPTSEQLLSRQRTAWRAFRDQSRLLTGRFRDIQHLVPYADYFLNYAGLRGSPFEGATWSGIVMTPAFHYRDALIDAPRRRSEWFRQLLFERALATKGLVCIFTIDEYLASFYARRSRGISNESRVAYLPDPATVARRMRQVDARSRLGIHPDADVVLAYGTMNRRKGLDCLAGGLRRIARPIVLVSAGSHDENSLTILSKLDQDGVPVRVLDRFVNDAEEAMVFSAADVVWLGYEGHYGMSGVLVKAASYGMPVVSCAEGLIGRLTADRKLGSILSSRDPTQVAAAITAALAYSADEKFRTQSRQWADGHSVDVFCQHLFGTDLCDARGALG